MSHLLIFRCIYNNTLLQDNILEEFTNLIVIKSISKSYGVPGIRLGVIASADTNLINFIKKMFQYGISTHLESTTCKFLENTKATIS